MIWFNKSYILPPQQFTNNNGDSTQERKCNQGEKPYLKIIDREKLDKDMKNEREKINHYLTPKRM